MSCAGRIYLVKIEHVLCKQRQNMYCVNRICLVQKNMFVQTEKSTRVPLRGANGRPPEESIDERAGMFQWVVVVRRMGKNKGVLREERFLRRT